MKILFITPYDNNYKYKTSFTKSLTYMPLTMPYLAALTPKSICTQFKAVDEGVEVCDYEKLPFYDVVAITSVTSSVLRGYELAAFFKKKGSHVVMGGHHVSLIPQEAILYADTILTGPADRIWVEFLNDFLCGKTKQIYDGSYKDINLYKVIPKREIMNKKKYIGTPTEILM